MGLDQSSASRSHPHAPSRDFPSVIEALRMIRILLCRQGRNLEPALVVLSGDIEGRIILDMDAAAASQVASDLSEIAGAPTDEGTREIVCELTNMVIGNSVTQLNDRGYKFRVHPPEIFLIDVGPRGSLDSETVLMRFELPKGAVYLNLSVRAKSDALVGSPA